MTRTQHRRRQGLSQAARVRVGARIRALRAEQGMTALEVAAAAGLTQAGVSKLEAGEGDPRLSTLVAVLGVLCPGMTATIAVAGLLEVCAISGRTLRKRVGR